MSADSQPVPAPPPLASDEPNPTLLPSPRAPLTPTNLWRALTMTKSTDLTPTGLAEIPCMRQSLLQGTGAGVGFAVLRLLSGKPGARTTLSALNWAFGGFLVIGGLSNLYCHQKRTEEIEMMRLVQQRYPERNLVAAGRRAKAEAEAREAAGGAGGGAATAAAAAGAGAGDWAVGGGDKPAAAAAVEDGLGQKVNWTPPPTPETSQPRFVEVRDGDGQYVGRMSPAMADLARQRGATETFSAPTATPAAVDTSGVPALAEPDGAAKQRGWGLWGR